jgi:hypothetical protein
MVCEKCHQNEATIHLTTVMDGKEEDTLNLCKNCAPPLGFENLTLEQLQALSVVGKKCEFCGKPALSGEMVPGGNAIYWCFDCGAELGRIVTDLLMSERADFMQRAKEGSLSLLTAWNSQVQAWSVEAQRKAVQLLRDRRRQDGRDKGS